MAGPTAGHLPPACATGTIGGATPDLPSVARRRTSVEDGRSAGASGRGPMGRHPHGTICTANLTLVDVVAIPEPAGWEDSLTGLEGPDFWQRVLVAEVARSLRYERNLTVVQYVTNPQRGGFINGVADGGVPSTASSGAPTSGGGASPQPLNSPLIGK